MGRNKTQKFADNAARSNVVQAGKDIYDKIKGRWNQLQFGNDHPLILELACGRGEYSVGLGEVYPEKNFIGIDIKGARIWKGSGIAIEKGLNNVAFLRTHIQNLEDFFEDGEVSEIWIVHPDPRPKDSDERRRLTNDRFLETYKRLLGEQGLVRLKTDNTGLYEYTLEVLNNRNDVKILDCTDDLYKNQKLLMEHHGIETRYEQEFHAQGHTIKYIKFHFN